MIPIEKVKLIVDTYIALEKELSSGDIDKKNFVKKSKKYSSIGEVINEAIYGLGAPCGGSIMTYDNKVYRSYGGGIAPIDDNLAIQSLERIGNFEQSQVYHVEILNDYIYFTLTDYSTMNILKKIDSNGNELASYNVGVNPGDLAFWKKSE